MDIGTLVRQTCSPENDVRETAENSLIAAGAQMPEYILNSLFLFVADASVPDGQAAMFIMKNLVINHWSPALPRFVGPIWDNSVKVHFRGRLIATIASPETRVLVRSAAVSIVNRIARVDFPEEWPDLVEITIGMLLSDETYSAGLYLFREILEETVREQDFWQHASQIMQRLFYLIPNTEYPSQLYSIQCFHQCMNMFFMGEDESQQDHLGNLAQKQLDHWCVLFAKLLKTSRNHDVVHELIETIQDLHSVFPEIMAKQLPLLFEANFISLKGYTDEEMDESQDIIAIQLDFFLLVLNNSPVVVEQLRKDPDTLASFISLCVRHSYVTEILQDSFIDDFNVFITHEQELSMEVWPRPSAGAVIGAVKTKNTISFLIQYLQRSTHWIDQEATLFLLSCALQQLKLENQDISESEISYLVTFLAGVTNEAELLFARAAITGGIVARQMATLIDQDSRLAFVKRSADMLLQEGHNFSDLVKSALLEAISYGYEAWPLEFAPYQQVILSTIASLISDAEDDTPLFLLNCFLGALRLNFEVAASLDGVFNMFFALVAKCIGDNDHNAELLDVVAEFLESTKGSPQSHETAIKQFLTPAVRMIEQSGKNGVEYSSDLQFAIDLCGTAFEKCNVEVIAGDMENLSGLLENLVLTCSDPEILQSSTFTYAALMERHQPNELSNDHLQRILQVAAKLLGPGLKDSAAVAAGRIILVILENFADQGEILGDVFIAAAKRMIDTTHAGLVESIGLAFASLFIKDCTSAVTLLHENQLLEPYMKKWISTFEVVRGSDEILKYIQALIVVYNAHDPRVEEILVDDEPVPRPDNGPVTRSKGLRFTQVPLPIKITKLLVHALDTSPPPNSWGLEEDDDEWADEFIHSLGNNTVDTRAFTCIMEWCQDMGVKNGALWYQCLNTQERNILLSASQAGNIRM